MKIDLSGKVAVVTGATGQLGRTMVRSLAECGADVVLCYHKNQTFAEQLKDEIESTWPVKAMAVMTDITSLDSIMALQKSVSQQLGTADIIVNNAVTGISQWKSVLEQDVKDYEGSQSIRSHRAGPSATGRANMTGQKKTQTRISRILTGCP
ncbi:MAG: SDR family NAD(P)-dependent oxidoreductase [Bacillota bacterium]|nr:SDR family NAD(P)-dependent oxidoreductase [Bacillota bacterium]